MAEAERFLPSFTDKVEAILENTAFRRVYCYARDGLPERLRSRDAGRTGAGGKAPGATTCTWR